MTAHRGYNDHGMGFGSPDAGLGNNSGLGSDAGLGDGSGYGPNSGLGGVSSGGSRLGSKWGTGGLGFTGGLGWSGGLRGSKREKFAQMAGLNRGGGGGGGYGGGYGGGNGFGGSGNRDMNGGSRGQVGRDQHNDDDDGLGGGLGGLDGSKDGGLSDLCGSGDGGLGGSGLGGLDGSHRPPAPPATHPVDPPILLQSLRELEKAHSQVFKGLDKYGDGALLALFENKWFKRLRQLCDRLGNQASNVSGLLSHTTALPSPGLNMALQNWMNAVTDNLYNLHTEMENVAVVRLITMAGDVGDASDMADAVESGDPGEVADTATDIAVTDAAQDVCEEVFGRIDGQLARCYKILMQRAAEMDNQMMPALQYELSGGGWHVPNGPPRW